MSSIAGGLQQTGIQRMGRSGHTESDGEERAFDCYLEMMHRDIRSYVSRKSEAF